MFTVNGNVQIYDHSEPTYNGMLGIIRQIQNVRNSIYYMVEINNRLIPCTEDELIED